MSLRGEIVWDTSEFRRFIAQALPRAVEASALVALDKAGDDSLERARRIVPRDTGALHDTLRKEPEARSEGCGYAVGITAGGGGVVNPKTLREVDYAAHVEFGTSRQQPRPYLRPALRTAAGKVPRYFVQALNGRLR